MDLPDKEVTTKEESLKEDSSKITEEEVFKTLYLMTAFLGGRTFFAQKALDELPDDWAENFRIFKDKFQGQDVIRLAIGEENPKIIVPAPKKILTSRR